MSRIMKMVDVVIKQLPLGFKKTIVATANSLPFGEEALRQYRESLIDVHVISYPKCGRTWLRLVLGKILQEHYHIRLENPSDLLEVRKYHKLDSRVPYVRFSHDDNPHMKRTSELEHNKEAYTHTSVVFLSRDPRDVVVSNYFQESRRETVLEDSLGFRGSLTEFLQHEIHGIENIVAFMNIWASNRHIPKRFMLLRYEDMIRDIEREIWRVLSFLGVDGVSPEVVHQAIQFGSFDSMKRLETKNVLGNPRLQAIDPDDPDSYKIRRGKVGGYVDYMDPEAVKYVDTIVAEKLDAFYGYHA